MPEEKLAYQVDELNEILPLGRTKAWEEIAAGRLRARKIGRRTVVLAEDLRDYLASLPEAR
jgi:Helix-turn-helix domain